MKSILGILVVALSFLFTPNQDASAQPSPPQNNDLWPTLESPQPLTPAQAPALVEAGAPPAVAPAQPPPPTTSQGMAALYRASAVNRYLFVFFYKEQNPQSDAMWAVLQAALAKVPGRAETAVVRITDPMEQEMVKGYGVDRAPMPMVLALAPNGAVMGGFPGKVEEAQILGAFGTPGMEKTMKLLQDRRMVFLCFQNPTTQQNEAAMYGINELRADPNMGGAVVTVLVDPADPQEARFLAQFQIDPTQNVAQTVMLVPPGATVGKFMGGTTKTMLLSKLESAGGCGPGGCAGGVCGPPTTAPQQTQSKGIVAKVKSVFGK